MNFILNFKQLKFKYTNIINYLVIYMFLTQTKYKIKYLIKHSKCIITTLCLLYIITYLQYFNFL